MECREARGLLWPPERLRVVGGDVEAARIHVRDCDGCREYFRQDEALLDLYARVREVPAPLSVRRRVFDTLAATRWSPLATAGVQTAGGGERTGSEAVGAADPTPALRWTGARVALAAAALAAAVAVGQLRSASIEAEPTAVFVEDHLRRAVGQEHIVSDDPREIRRFIERELGLPIEPLTLDGYALASAEICLLEGRRGAMIVYEGSAGAVSHYVVPREGATARPPAVSTTAGGPAMPVVTWATSTVEQALVGEMPADELLEIASRGLR